MTNLEKVLKEFEQYLNNNGSNFQQEIKSNEINNKTILFSKINPTAFVPTKRDEDGAYDIYPCFEEDCIVLRPHETRMIPTGIASAFSSNYVAIIKERGSTGTKGIGQRAGVIDSGFRGEWFLPITNHNNYHMVIAKAHLSLEEIAFMLTANSEVNIPFKVYPYEKAIAQFIMVEVPKLDVKLVPYEELLKHTSKRGLGALGSSDK